MPSCSNDSTKYSAEQIGRVLVDASAPIAKRTRCIFLLKRMGTDEAMIALSKGLYCSESVLLQHEVGYALGQMRKEAANPILEAVLRNTDENCIVRHEAAEALAAIGSASSEAVLSEFANDEHPEVSESCELALERLRWLRTCTDDAMKGGSGGFDSIDPAPPANSTDVNELRATLCDENAPLFQRYRAMFALRNLQSNDATMALCAGFADRRSALLRHELAYVLGQLQRDEAAPTLVNVLRDASEHCMVRHEVAEALGAIGSDDAMRVLGEYVDDDAKVVAQSCEVAIDIHDYWTQPPSAAQ